MTYDLQMKLRYQTDSPQMPPPGIAVRDAIRKVTMMSSDAQIDRRKVASQPAPRRTRTAAAEICMELMCPTWALKGNSIGHYVVRHHSDVTL